MLKHTASRREASPLGHIMHGQSRPPRRPLGHIAMNTNVDAKRLLAEYTDD